MIIKNQRALVLCGGLGGALYGVNMVIGASLSWAFGMFGLSGLVTGIPVGFTFYLASRLTRSFGAVTVLWTLYSLFAIPTPLMGPPVPHKVVIGFAGALAYDVAVWIMRRTAPSYYVAFIAYAFVMTTLFIMVFVGTDLGAYAEQVSDLLKTIILVVFVTEGLLSTWVASRWWKQHIAGTALEHKFTIEQ